MDMPDIGSRKNPRYAYNICHYPRDLAGIAPCALMVHIILEIVAFFIYIEDSLRQSWDKMLNTLNAEIRLA